jgi:hypothetical protein
MAKKLRKYKHHTMIHGGNQLAELIETRFPLDWLKANLKKLGMDETLYTTIEIWRKEDYAFDRSLRALAAHYGDIVNRYTLSRLFQYPNQDNLLYRLLRLLDVRPQLDAQGAVIDRLFFLEYDEYWIEGDTYRVVQTKLNRQQYWRTWPTKRDLRKYENVYVYRMYKGRWILTQTRFAREYLQAMKTVKHIL